MLCCQFRCSCTTRALIFSAIVGILTTFLLITSSIVLTTIFLWVAFGIAAGYLLVLGAAEVIAAGRRCVPVCCGARNMVLGAALGTVFLSLVQLALGLNGAGLAAGLLAGGLLFFFALTLSATACYVQCLTGCTERE